jgi:hypothetical protein
MPPGLPHISGPALERVRVIALPLGFAGLALVFAVEPAAFQSPVPAATRVPKWAVSTETVRRPKLAPYIDLAGRRFTCRDCHDKFLFSEDPPLEMHWNIVLAHGINDRCLNCHHATNRDALAGNRADEIPYDQPQLLCAKCHGPVYRDWLNRSHGRTNGYWDERFGPVVRRRCIECHDPHQPPFPPTTPAPPPRTIRMGDQDFPAEHEAVPNPLRPRSLAPPPAAAGHEHSGGRQEAP